MNRSPSEPRTNRRQFGKRITLLAAAPLAAPVLAAEEDKPKEVPIPEAVALALTEVVRLRHGKHLSKDQLKRIGNSIIRSQYVAVALRNKLELSNADEPAFTFHADLP